MDSLITDISHTIFRLRAVISEQDESQIDRSVETLRRYLIDAESYRNIFDERLLGNAIQLLRTTYGPEYLSELVGLESHKEAVVGINDRLYAVINPIISLDELLFIHFDKWPQLDSPIGCSFDPNVRENLTNAREIRNTEQKLQIFTDVYFKHLRNNGCESAVEVLEKPVFAAIDGYKRLKKWTVQCLFLTGDIGDVYGIKIKGRPNGTGLINPLNQIDSEMHGAAMRAITCVKNIYPNANTWDFTWEVERSDLPLSGNSIGLALTIGMLSEMEGFDIDSFTAFTGHVIWDTGKIERIAELRKKLEAAKELGVRRVLIPLENTENVEDIGLEIIKIGTIQDAKRVFTDPQQKVDTPLEQILEIKIRRLEIELEQKGIRRSKPIQGDNTSKRLTFTDFRDEAIVIIYFGKKGITPVVQGKDTLLKQTVKLLCDQIFNKMNGNKIEDNSQQIRCNEKYQVRDTEKQERIKDYIFQNFDALEESEQNCLYRAKVVKGQQIAFVRQFANGTLTINGPEGIFSEINEFIRSVLGISNDTEKIIRTDGMVSKDLVKIEVVKSLDLGDQWIGTDEAGKGDFYGPLVGAAVFVDKRIVGLLENIGVKDSKELSDKRNLELASRIVDICGKRAQAVVIPPNRYNQLYEQFQREGKNLNTLLAWAHTRALEDILSVYPQKEISVIVDKFADEHYIKSKLLEQSRRTKLNLVQLPKAEANIAVAAASILARASFLQWLARLSKQLGMELPKGASDSKIYSVGQEILKAKGKEGLSEYAKLHFKTTQKIIGL